jgi:hypothetical protein
MNAVIGSWLGGLGPALAAGCLGFAAIAACGGAQPEPQTPSTTGASSPSGDTSRVEAGRVEAGRVEAGRVEAGRVEAGRVEAGGYTASTPIADAEQTVAAMRADFRRCYAAGLAKNPALEGALVVQANVERTGQVGHATAQGGESLGQDVVECILNRVRQSKFSPPGDGGSTLQIPVSFARNGS